MHDIELRFEEDSTGDLIVVFARRPAQALPSASAVLVLDDQGDSFIARWEEPAALSAAA
jgi:hypothetical protein